MRQIVSVGVFRLNTILMAIRRDDTRWTFPGGHIEAGETPIQAAIRETYEEAGILLEAGDLQPLGRWVTKDFKGQPLEVFPFRVNWEAPRPEPQVMADADREIDRWFWIDCQPSLPTVVMENLHSPRNALLMAVGLQEPEEGIARFCKAWPQRLASQMT